MKRNSFIVVVALMLLSGNTLFGQIESFSGKKDRIEQQLIKANKIKEIKAYRYNFTDNGLSNRKELVLQKIYNNEGVVEYQLSKMGLENYITEIQNIFDADKRYPVGTASKSYSTLNATITDTLRSYMKFTYKDSLLVSTSDTLKMKYMGNTSIYVTTHNFEYNKEGKQTSFSLEMFGCRTTFTNRLDNRGNAIMTYKSDVKVVDKKKNINGERDWHWNEGAPIMYCISRQYDEKDNLVYVKDIQNSSITVEENFEYDRDNKLIEYKKIRKTLLSDPESLELDKKQDADGSLHFINHYNEKNFINERIYKDIDGKNIYLVKYEYIYF